jgi:5-formyltetrahydrofolate cyclo-ligase
VAIVKSEIRNHIWQTMTEARVGAFPFPLKGRIPNFRDARKAAERLFASEVWQRARVIKANPDAPQRPVRRRALEEGKTLYMAVPRLRERDCFIHVAVPPDLAAKAATIKGAFEYGQLIHPSRMQPVDLVVAGTVTVNAHGERIGKGGGFSDLELAIGHAFGLLNEETTFVTTVHDLQVAAGDLPQMPHDVLIDHIFTPTRSIATHKRGHRSKALFWELLSADQIEDIPILGELRENGAEASSSH